MLESQEENKKSQVSELEEGTYEIILNRLGKHGVELRQRIDQLNSVRKELFGSVEMKLLTTERITTENKCVPRDMISLGDKFIFGYNVHIGLRTVTKLNDVFSVYQYDNHQFHLQGLSWIGDETFLDDFNQLYKYYKETQFNRFVEIGPFLYMVFLIGKGKNDIKTFKWRIETNKLVYIDNRSDHEVVIPNQHEFSWIRTTRDMYRNGAHPHVSIEDQVFVETIGGDLTIKVEDNTDEGRGVYEEPVEAMDQTLDDAEISYAIVGNLIFLKIKPYKENDYRYILFNKKISEALRVDAIREACVLLPNDHGVIFPRGYYLQNGTYKIFDLDVDQMQYQQTISSSNGEDYLYVFHNNVTGNYVLLTYNVITQEVFSPTICHGYTLFPNGELCYFKGEEEAQNHHAIQIWETPFKNEAFTIPENKDSLISKIGNKEIVTVMAECGEVLHLLKKEDTYDNLYVDLVKKTTDISDSYYWLDKQETFNLKEPLDGIKSSASLAIDEFDKVTRIKKDTKQKQSDFEVKFKELQSRINVSKFERIDDFVEILTQLRVLRGEVISLKDLRYIDLDMVDDFETEIEEKNEFISEKCVSFLLSAESLDFYKNRILEFQENAPKLSKVVEVDEFEEQILKTSRDLEMLIEIVSNLKIEDATETTKIINNISDIYSQFNQIYATIKRKRKELQVVEGEAVFISQLKLISQGMVNYLDISDSVQKCDEYLTKLLIQLEELEGRFSDFDEFLGQLNDKREEIYNAFESRKVYLTDKKNKRISRLQTSADRVLKGVENRLKSLKTVEGINGYLASDLMVDKLRNVVEELLELGDTVKADDILGKLKSLGEEAVRQLKDKTELISAEGSISFGRHSFFVNQQSLDLSIVPRGEDMYYHITGTNFFERIQDKDFLETKPVWNQSIVSENEEVYRSEYLAWQILSQLESEFSDFSQILAWPKDKYEALISDVISKRYDEGYVKGIHDHDALLILKELVKMIQSGGVLKYAPEVRACAIYYWQFVIDSDYKNVILSQIKSVGNIQSAFPDTKVYDALVLELGQQIEAFIEQSNIFNNVHGNDISGYLFAELAHDNKFSISKESYALSEAFHTYLKENKKTKLFSNSITELREASSKYTIAKSWLSAYAENHLEYADEVLSEAAVALIGDDHGKRKLINVDLNSKLEGLQGIHARIKEQDLTINYHDFVRRLRKFETYNIPFYQQFNHLKREYIKGYKEELRLDELKPKVMSSFVRNKLINQVYLPLIGDNLAKQIGTSDDNKRTDLMGMLLLISPPGYGKTTLMEYIASRLGIIFLKINGPSLGHETTSLDPEMAPNSAAREEIKKLNLGLEMGDNVMIYLDDIQHCHPEFLQKFISLSDAQRKIEGVYKGKSKTYDLRGKKVCVVMAGNPYTESGDKFKIPDMLANRADIYNLGDIIGETDEAFESSYIENCLTSNTTLRKLSGKSQKDLYQLMDWASTGERGDLEFESNHSVEDMNDYVSVLKKLIKVRDIVLRVNKEYIKSAAMEDQFRKEPPFKLQGSYRNMNKIAEKIVPIMNDKELDLLILNAYESESQTLTTSSEANLLKFKEMVGWMREEDISRWSEIKTKFQKNQRLRGFGDQNQMAMILSQIERVSEGLIGIKNELSKN
ncbi:DNA repair ATPase [bacterium SCSIO 12643]|nr:DNA repair ATPase [bacterium SCSIO 12643]